MAQTKQPIDKIRLGRITATIWENEGKNGAFYNVVTTRTYRDDDGNYQDASNLSGSDLLVAAVALVQAFVRTEELRAASSKPEAETDAEGFTRAGRSTRSSARPFAVGAATPYEHHNETGCRHNDRARASSRLPLGRRSRALPGRLRESRRSHLREPRGDPSLAGRRSPVRGRVESRRHRG